MSGFFWLDELDCLLISPQPRLPAWERWLGAPRLPGGGGGGTKVEAWSVLVSWEEDEGGGLLSVSSSWEGGDGIFCVGFTLVSSAECHLPCLGGEWDCAWIGMLNSVTKNIRNKLTEFTFTKAWIYRRNGLFSENYLSQKPAPRSPTKAKAVGTKGSQIPYLS